MTDAVDDDLRLAILRLARRIRLERGDTDVSDSQLSVLFVLLKEGQQSLGSLSDYERVTSPSMNRTVNCLIESGLVSRENAADDGRKVLISLTDAGRELARETRRRREAWFAQRLAELPPADRAALTAAAPILQGIADS